MSGGGNKRNAVRWLTRAAIGLLAAGVIGWVLGFVFTPRIDIQAHKPAGDRIWKQIVAYKTSTGSFPESEEQLLASGILTAPERRLYLDRHFGHRKFHYFVDDRKGPCLTLDHIPGTLSGITVWRDRSHPGQEDP